MMHGEFSDDEEDVLFTRIDSYGTGFSYIEDSSSHISRHRIPSEAKETVDEFPLHTAVNQNDAQQVKMLLDSLPSLARSVDEQARTALHLACKLGRIEIAELILRTSANVTAQDFSGRTCLHYSESVELTTMLLDSGSNPNVQDDQGMTPLHVAVMSCNVACVRVLLAYGADPTIVDTARRRSVVHIAVEAGSPEVLACVLHESRHLIQLNAPDIDGNSAIHLAAMSTNRSGQQQNMLTILLDRGASALVLNNRLISALHFVCANLFLCEANLAEPLAEILLDQEASPNAQDCDGCTPLVIAAAHREWGLCRLLLEAGGDLNIPCPMNCYLLSTNVRFNLARDEVLKKSDCTASDLLPRKARALLFPCICVPQTSVPAELRDNCMNCGEAFGTTGSGAALSPISPVPANGIASKNSNGALSSASAAGGAGGVAKSSSGRSLSTATNTTNNSDSIPPGNHSNRRSFFGAGGFMSSLFQTLRLTSGKHHCRICNRVVCGDCSNNFLEMHEMPEFFQDAAGVGNGGTADCNPQRGEHTNLRVCKVCFAIQQARNHPDPA